VEVKGLGQVTADEEEASAGRLVRGTPYLVMDHVTGGTLRRFSPHYDWATVQAVLLDLLDALAHAHALGVVHRDLKTANVLLETDGARQNVKLADFGIARAFGRGEPLAEDFVPESVSGTPATMAPEQAQGLWRDEGPWTDLYALGIVAWGLTCGRRPFEGNTVEVLDAHVRSPLPPFEPRFAVPERFEAWLRKMLAKQPGDRFRFAADAAFGLLTLPPPIEQFAPSPISFEGEIEDGESYPPLAVTFCSGPSTLTALHEVAHQSSPSEETESWPVPPPPHRWRAPTDAAASNPPMGLELFGIRSAPIIGREQERDVLWSAVSTAGDSSLTLVSGEAGTGKTRLMEWIEQRSHELGSANVLRAQFNEYAGYADGLAPMLERFFRTNGLDRDSVFERIAKIQGEIGARGVQAVADLMVLVDIVRPRDGVGLRHRSERESFLSLIRTLDHIAADRPLLVCIENIQWSDEAVRFIEAVLEHATGPIVVVASLESDPETAQIARRLLALESATSLELTRVQDDEIRRLVDSLVRLTPDLLSRVVEAAAGNPRTAIELMTAWVQSGALQNSEHGYVTAEHAATLPFSVASMWKGAVGRVCAVFGDREEDARLLIELATVLGTVVDPEEWAIAARQLDLELPPALVEGLVFEGLLLQRDDVLRFRTGDAAEMIRENARADEGR
jgi:serine/threonine protein kinase